MAFGQQSGYPASARQVEQLTTLVIAAGHDDLRGARYPLDLTQRQAAGKFTSDEADALIAQLEAEAEGRPASESPSPDDGDEADQPGPLGDIPTAVLAAELQSRGWIVVEP
jgi:hypothetical protein